MSLFFFILVAGLVLLSGTALHPLVGLGQENESGMITNSDVLPANMTDNNSTSGCPADYYGPGGLDDLRLRSCSDYCKNYYGDGFQDLIERGPECDLDSIN